MKEDDGSETSEGRDEAPSISLGHPGALLQRDKKSISTRTPHPKEPNIHEFMHNPNNDALAV